MRVTAFGRSRTSQRPTTSCLTCFRGGSLSRLLSTFAESNKTILVGSFLNLKNRGAQGARTPDLSLSATALPAATFSPKFVAVLAPTTSLQPLFPPPSGNPVGLRLLINQVEWTRVACVRRRCVDRVPLSDAGDRWSSPFRAGRCADFAKRRRASHPASWSRTKWWSRGGSNP